MAKELGAWLRQQREARGWPRPEMARHLIKAAQARGDKSIPGLDSMCHNIYRWERGADGLSDRYKLHYCHALGITPGQFGPGRADSHAAAPTPGTIIMAATPGVPVVSPPPQDSYASSGLADPALVSAGAVAYRGVPEPDMDDSTIRREVLMAAHEGSEHASGAEEHGIGEATFEQLRADVRRLSRESDTGESFPLFLDMRRVREKIYRLLERRLWPGEQADLYFLLSCLNGLMGITADRLGYPDAAEELIRAGWAYATAINYQPLLGSLRQQLAYVAYSRGRFRDSRDLAASGLDYLPAGPMAANLHCKHAQASAKLGDVATARQAITAAHEAREADYTDDLLQIGGEWSISLATHHYFAGAALAEIEGAEREAAAEIERAASLYAAGPGPDEQHWFGGRALAEIDLAVIRLRSGAIDAAVAALDQVLVLPPAQRITALTVRLRRVRAELAAPIFRRSAQARKLDAQIEEFGREAVTAGLHGLSGGPG